MAADFASIASTSIGTATASYTFTSIPQTYKHLYIVAEIFGSNTGEDTFIQVGNGSADTASNYSGGWLRGISTTVSSIQNLNNTAIRVSDGGSQTGTTQSQVIDFYIMNYSNANTNKAAVGHSGNTNRGQDLFSGMWRSNSAIDTIKVYIGVGNIAANSKISIFGIKG